MVSTSEIVESYKTFLEVKYQSQYQRFCDLLKNQPESAKAEAVLFSLMRSMFHDVKIGEDISSGGPDFICNSNEGQFILEVTSLESEAVASQSGWANSRSEESTVFSFSMITHMLRTKASGKARQVSGYPMPRVVAITTEHIGADFLVGPHGAETLLTSDTKITVPLGKPIEETYLTTDLRDSVFFRVKNGVFESCRRSISAILLVSLYAARSSIIGILHPDPEHKFSIDLLPSVPFLRVREWPPENKQIETEWVIRKPKPIDFYYSKVKFKDEELRSI